MNRKIWASIVVAGILSAIICFSILKKGGTQPASVSKVFSSIEDANNQFALDFYSRLKNEESGNIFFSPYSMSMALAMTYEGARGQTAEEIRSVFYFPDTDQNNKKAEGRSISQHHRNASRLLQQKPGWQPDELRL